MITCYTFSHQSPIVNVNNLVSYFTDGRVMEQKTNREREKIIFFFILWTQTIKKVLTVCLIKKLTWLYLDFSNVKELVFFFLGFDFTAKVVEPGTP